MSAAERAALSRLASVRRQREPFVALSRGIIAAVLDRYLPSEGRVVEIGMGDGQLRSRLPEPILPRILHTEPQASASRAFRKEHPDVVVVQAPAEKLPLAAGEAAAGLAMCVMDVVSNPAAVVRELWRVLRPGGRFIHFLDMSTVLTPVVATLEGSDLVLLPNVFAEPAAGAWPEDLFLVPRQQLALIVAILRESGHGLARPLGQYLNVFSTSPLGVSAAVAELVQIQDNAQLRSALRGAFRAAFELAPPEARQELARFQGRPVSSALSFEQRLRSWFGPDAGFQVEQSSLEKAFRTVPRATAGHAYMSCSVGEQRYLPHVPEALLCEEASRVDLADDETLQELGIFVFVASKV